MKRKLGSKKVVSIVITAMAVMLGANSIITTYAEEDMLSENWSEVQEKSLGEAKTPIETANDAADAAEEAVEEVKNAVEEIVSENQDNITAQTKTEEEIKHLEEAVTDAEQAASEAAEKVDAAKEMQEQINEYNADVKEAQEEVGELTEQLVNTMENGDIIVDTTTSEDGQQTHVTLQEYVEEKAAAATDAAGAAQENLNKALEEKVSGDTAKLQEYVDATKEAAQMAVEAKKEAEDVYKTAEMNLIEEIKKYNAYADAYGLACKYYEDSNGQRSVPRYTEEELASAGMTLTGTERNELLAERQETVKEDLTTQLAKISNAETAVTQAAVNCEAIQTQATEALEKATVAALLVEDCAQKTKEEADKLLGTVDEQAAKEAVERVETAEQISAEEIAKAQSTIETIKAETQQAVEAAQNGVEAAAEKYETAKQELEKVQKELKKGYFIAGLDMKELAEKIAEAEKAVQNAHVTLIEAQQAASMAESCQSWAEALTTDEVTRIYGQITSDGEVAYENLKNFDINNDDVISRDTSNFTEITLNKTGVTVPAEIFTSYVQFMQAQGYSYQDVTKNHAIGEGVSIGTSMPIVYWRVDENGNLDANSAYYLADAEGKPAADMPYGRYFVGYTFKHEGDGYHIDGIMYEYEDPGTEPGENPGTEPDENPGTDPSENPSDNPSENNTVTITDEVTPLAESIPSVDSVIINEEEVPLIETVSIEEEKTPLAESVPKTGDETMPALPFAAASMVAFGAAIIAYLKKKHV